MRGLQSINFPSDIILYFVIDPFDNFFTSHQLLDNLAKKNLRVLEPSGPIDYRSDGNVLFALWKDNSIVFIGTNLSSITPLKKVNRSVKGAGKVAVDQPNLITDYNTGMGGVDLLGMKLASYRPKLTSKKWWWPFLANTMCHMQKELQAEMSEVQQTYP